MLQSIRKGDLNPCVQIVNHGFPVDNPVVDCGANLLMHVASTCTAQQLETILTLNPDVNAQDNIGRTALHYACRAGKLDTFTVLANMEPIEVDMVTNAGVTPLMMAIESGNIELVAEALNANLNPFLSDALGRTALDYAGQFRNVKGHDMRALIETAME